MQGEIKTSYMAAAIPVAAMTRVEIGQYRAKLECLRRNRENVTKELLTTKYREPYVNLQKEIKDMTEQIVKDVATYYLSANGSCVDEMIEEINTQITRLGFRKKISDAVFHKHDADLMLKYASQVRELAQETARRWNIGG